MARFLLLAASLMAVVLGASPAPLAEELAEEPELASLNPPAYPKPITIANSVGPEEGRPRLHFAAGALGGTRYLCPTLNVDVALSPDLALGVVPFYFEKRSLVAFGAYLHGDYRPLSVLAVFARAAVGLYALSGNNSIKSETVTPLAVALALGYRQDLGNGWALTATAGGQYVDHAPTLLVPFGNWMPWLAVAIGLSP